MPKDTKTIQPTPGAKAPQESREGRLPKQLTEAQLTEVLAKVRSKSAPEAEALEEHFEYLREQRMVPESEKLAVEKELAELRAWRDAIKGKSTGLKEHMSYWVTLFEDEKGKALPQDRQISSPEYIAQKTLDYLLLS